MIIVGEEYIYLYGSDDGDSEALANHNARKCRVTDEATKTEAEKARGGLFGVEFEDGEEFGVYGDELLPVEDFTRSKFGIYWRNQEDAAGPAIAPHRDFNRGFGEFVVLVVPNAHRLLQNVVDASLNALPIDAVGVQPAMVPERGRKFGMDGGRGKLRHRPLAKSIVHDVIDEGDILTAGLLQRQGLLRCWKQFNQSSNLQASHLVFCVSTY